MAIKKYQVIGLMSGSSLDGLDIAYCTFDIDKEKENPVIKWELHQAATVPFSEKWIARLAHLPHASAKDYARTHTYLGRYMGEIVQEFIAFYKLTPDFIASHGHTIFHEPDGMFTAQIGEGAALAAVSGFPVVCDFRTADIARKGEGAPFAPIADKYLLDDHDFYLNIGGIANITCNANGKFIAFDTAPANQVLNILANQLELPYDDKGAKAASGKVNNELLNTVNSIDYFSKKYPKSMDNQWVQTQVVPKYIEASGTWEDKLNTAVEQLAIQTKNAIQNIIQNENLNKEKYTLFPTGGAVSYTHLTLPTILLV